ncbi:MAG: N-acetyltransferase [Chloroflexi bacterium]|nr:MAG: N-acetyltransferase [Chloroflexota bacterium]
MLPNLAEAADENLVTHATWVQRQTAGMAVIEESGLVLADSGLACDTFNLICHTRLDRDTAPAQIHRAIHYFANANRPFSWWTGPADQPADLGDLLLAAGLVRAETELAMAADLAQLAEVDLSPQGLRIERVRTLAQLHDFANLVAALWTPPDTNVVRFYELAAPLLLSAESPLWFYVGYLDAVPVGTVELTVGGGVVGLYSVSTVATYRRRGFGSALTVWPLLDARTAGYTTAILQAAAAGVGIYKRVGFEVFGEITEYKPPL